MNNEEWYVILNMNCKYEICRMCPKSGLFKGTYEECEKWIEQKQKEEMKDELQTWKKASENNSYKAFHLQEENKMLSKHILELQKDKGELVDRCKKLEHQLTHRNCLDCSNHSSKLRMRTLELEKENAELKKQLEMSNKVYNDNLDYSHHIEEQLTKAKEIIKDLLNLPFASNEEVFADVGSHLYKAEQFLKEVENV